MTDQEEQEDEILALCSIFDNILKVSKEGSLNAGELLVHPVLPDDFAVKVLKRKKGTCSRQTGLNL